ncbi:MAG: lycopene cyclase domain-containing protein [Ignavibacterium sp.]
MSTYLIINILIIIVPLILSFDKNISYYRKLPRLIFSILIVSSAFIIWDIFATKRGDWAFNPGHLVGIYIFGLPLEEVLFFITVPYSCVFIYETVKFYTKEKMLNISKNVFLVTGVILILLGIIFNYQHYTFTVSIFTGVFFLLAVFLKMNLLHSFHYWLTMLISFIPFLIVNYFLTSIPIVTYNDSAFFGKRFITIPLEDFLYSFSMISLWILFFEVFNKRKK